MDLMLPVSEVIQQERLLQQEVSSYRRCAYATSTQSTYRSRRDTYLRFCVYFGYNPVSVTANILCRYAAYLARSLQPHSVEAYLNVIRIMHLETGQPNPLQENWILNTVLKGIKRTHGKPQRQKLPITPDILHAIHSRLDLSCPKDMTFWAACVCAFFSFFRKATLLPASTANDNKYVRRSDIQLSTDYVIINVRRTKTIQYGDRILETPLPRIPDSILCPVAAIQKLLLVGPGIPPDAPLFSYPTSGSTYVRLVHPMFVQRLRSLLGACGYPEGQYSGHSFRRGGASYAFACGVPPAIIKLQGDWRSSAYERYLTVPLESKKLLSRMLALKISNHKT